MAETLRMEWMIDTVIKISFRIRYLERGMLYNMVLDSCKANFCVGREQLGSFSALLRMKFRSSHENLMYLSF